MPEDFDSIFDFLTTLVLRDNNYEPDFRLPGSLWMRELFMKAQTNILQLNFPLFFIVGLITAGNYMITTLILDSERTTMWWVFNVLCLMNTLMFTMV